MFDETLKFLKNLKKEIKITNEKLAIYFLTQNQQINATALRIINAINIIKYEASTGNCPWSN